MHFLYPVDVLKPRQPDELYGPEVAAIRAAGFAVEDRGRLVHPPRREVHSIDGAALLRHWRLSLYGGTPSHDPGGCCCMRRAHPAFLLLGCGWLVGSCAPRAGAGGGLALLYGAATLVQHALMLTGVITVPAGLGRIARAGICCFGIRGGAWVACSLSPRPG